jgi:hypothetical protein
MMMKIFIFTVISILACCSALRPRLIAGQIRQIRANTVLNALSGLDTLVMAVAEAKPDGYVYGAVSAPSWALPLGLVLVIATGAIPLLLSPGEKALETQRENEDTKGVKFGRKSRSEDL